MSTELSTEQVYMTYKPLLFSLAYRMLGSVTDAEDIVQDSFLALNGIVGSSSIRSLKAYLCKIVTNRCLDYLRSAKHKREVYVGPWLPEPLVTDGSLDSDPYQRAQLNESITTAYLLLLQQLSWTERSVFLLREVLQYEYEEIAEIVGKSSTNCRQIFHRAKRSISNVQATNTDAIRMKAGELIERFITALTTGDTQALLSTLSENAKLLSDGGGQVKAAIYPILGPDRIHKFLSGTLAKLPEGKFSFNSALIGGFPGIILYLDGQPNVVTSFNIQNGRIENIYLVVNPCKLRHLT